MARKHWLLLSLTFLMVLTLGSIAFWAVAKRDDAKVLAQQAQKPGDPPLSRGDEFPNLSEEEMRALVQTLEVWTLSERIGLTEEQLLRMIPKRRQLVQMREGFWKTRKDRIAKLSAVAEKPGVTDAELTGAISQFHKEDDAFWQQHKRLDDALMVELKPSQQVRYIIYDSQPPHIRRMMRALRQLGQIREQDIAARETAKSEKTAKRD